MWISQQSQELLAAVIRWHPCCMLYTDEAGHILWANKSFCEWSGYSLAELTRTTIQAINTLPDIMQDDFTAQVARMSRIDPTSSTKTQIRPKSDGPQWGTLHVTRHADVADKLVYFSVVWEPLKNSTAEAFTIALDHIKGQTSTMQNLQAEIRTVTQRDQDEDWIISTIRMARKYPKVTIAVFVVIASTFGLNSVLEMAQRLGFIGLPTVPTNPQTVQPATGFLSDPMQFPQYAGQGIASHPQAMSVTMNNGTVIEWNNDAGLRERTHRVFTGGLQLRAAGADHFRRSRFTDFQSKSSDDDSNGVGRM